MKFINMRMLTGELARLEIVGGRIQGFQTYSRMEKSGPATSLPVYVDHGRAELVDCLGELFVPGAVDAHVHSRDPGHTHKEDWQSLAAGAYKGGVVAVCDMPNTMPPTMERTQIMEKAEVASQSGLDFKFYLGVGKANIGSLRELLTDSSLPLCGLKVYYGQSTGELMYDDLERLNEALGADVPGLLSFHSEDQCSIDCAMAHHNTDRIDFRTPAAFVAHSEIRSNKSAWKSTEAILAWAIRHGRPIHIAHISTPHEVEMLLAARRVGLNVTTEVAPHHLIFSTDDYARLGPLIKMNPPVRSPEERAQLIKYFAAGEIELFATDHAPHTLDEKHLPYKKCPSGVPGIEYFWPLLLHLADEAGMDRHCALSMAATAPARLCGFRNIGLITDGYDANLVWVQRRDQILSHKQTVSKCGWTPYDGLKISYKVGATWHKGRLVYPR